MTTVPAPCGSPPTRLSPLPRISQMPDTGLVRALYYLYLDGKGLRECERDVSNTLENSNAKFQ